MSLSRDDAEALRRAIEKIQQRERATFAATRASRSDPTSRTWPPQKWSAADLEQRRRLLSATGIGQRVLDDEDRAARIVQQAMRGAGPEFERRWS